MYKLMVIVSLYVRNFILPNPFENLQYGVIINHAIEPLMITLSYLIVGLFYQRGAAPAWGSFLFLFFYAVHTGLIILCSKFSFSISAIIIISGLYIASIIGFVLLKNKLFHVYY